MVLIMDWDALEPYADMTLDDLEVLKSNIEDSLAELNHRLLRTKAALIALKMDERFSKTGGGCCGS